MSQDRCTCKGCHVQKTYVHLNDGDEVAPLLPQDVRRAARVLVVVAPAAAAGLVLVAAVALALALAAPTEVEVGGLVAEGLAQLPVDGGAVVGVELEAVELGGNLKFLKIVLKIKF